MREYAKFYYLYNSFLAKALRLMLFVGLGVEVISVILGKERFNTPLFFFSAFLMFETFFQFKIAKITPRKINKAAKDSLSVLEAFTLEAIKPFIDGSSTGSTLKYFLNKKQTSFILEKAGIDKKEIGFVDVNKNNLLDFSFKTARNQNGKYVTVIDVFVSYLILSEEKTKLLFSKNLKKDDLWSILSWARKENSWEERKKNGPIFWGKGVGEDFVTGWTEETEKYIWDITSDVLAEKPLLLGREEEYREIKEAMYRGKSIILVGEPGSGKTALVKAFAYESFMGNLKGYLYHQRILQLLVDTLVAGADNQNEIQERTDSIIREVSHASNIIIFVQDLENILGAATFDLDLSGVLSPYLRKADIKIISTTTPSSFKKFVEPMSSFLDVFKAIRLEEPSKDVVRQMVLEKIPEIEKKSNLNISYKAIAASLNLADKYLQNRVMPGRVIRLLEDTAGEVAISGKKIVEEQDVLDKIKQKTKIMVDLPKDAEKTLLLNLETKMHEYIVNQKDAVYSLSESLRRVRSGLNKQERPISFLFLGPTGVGKTATAKTFSSLYFGENRMIRIDMSEYAGEEGVKRLLEGSSENEGFIDKVYNNPFSLILLDEFEKADKAVADLFLQVLDDGRLTDSKGRLVSFTNAIIIATSNAGSEFIREEVEKALPATRQRDNFGKAFKLKLLNFLQEKGIFKPELLNRFDDIVVFKPLGKEEISKITKLILDKLAIRMLEKDIEVAFDDKVTEKIVKEGFDKEFGARPIHRFVQDNIEDLIAKKMLSDEIKRGSKVAFSTDDAGTITLSYS